MKILCRTALFALLAVACVPCVYGRGRASGYCQQGGQTIQVLGYQSSATTPVQGSYTGSGCNVLVLYSNGGSTTATGPSGIVSTNGTAVTWLSGNVFNANGQWTSLTITIASTPYVISTCASATSCTLTSSAGTQTSVAYSMSAATPAAIFSDNAGTGKSNPFAVSATGYWFYYADNGSYANQYSGTAIQTTYTNAAMPLADPSNLPNVARWNATLGTTFQQQCAASVAAPYPSLVIDSLAPVATGFTAYCNAIMYPGGLIQPASGQVFTLAGSISAPGIKIFDTSVAGPGSISFAAPAPPVAASWFGATVGTTSGATDTLYTPLFAAMESLPVAGPASVGNVYAGQVTLANTGSSNTSRYNLAQPLPLSPRVHLAGAYPSATTIGIPTTGFTGTYMINPFSASGSYPATNFDTGLTDVFLDAYTNSGSGTPGCVAWGSSVGSFIERLGCWTKGIGLVLGGSTGTPSVDNTSYHDLSFGLYPTSSALRGMTAQAIVFRSASYNVNTNVLYNVKAIGSGSPNTTYGCSGNPAIDYGAGNQGLQIYGMNLENVPCGLVIGDGTLGAVASQVQAGPDCYGNCTQSKFPWFALVDPFAINARVNGVCDVYIVCVAIGHFWRPSTNYNLNYTIVDYNANIQQLTTTGTGGSTQPSWNSSGTTTDGTQVWTYEGAVTASCSPSVTINCGIPTINTNGSGLMNGPIGASSGSDTNFYPFSYDSNVFFGNTNLVAAINAYTLQSQYVHFSGAHGEIILGGPNYSPNGNEFGANNALQINFEDFTGVVTPTPGTCLQIQLAHSLQAGANTLTINPSPVGMGTPVAIKSHFNPANNIATAYVAGSVFYGCLNNNSTLWLDMTQ